MDRTQKLKLNTIMSLFNRLAILISGLIIPRYILLYFGSETNGLVASINQFLNIITFLDLGVGSVIQSALYKPIAQRDDSEISRVIVAAKKYFSKIAYVLVAYAMGLMFLYPVLVDQSYDFLSTSFLIFALSLSIFAQYYFGIVNELLLNADQRGYIQLGTETIVVVLNMIATIFLVTQGASIQIVKLVAGIIYLIRPLYLTSYVNKNFNLNYEVELKKDPLPQKWSGMGQHIAYSIHNSTDVITLTLFSTLENVSVYAIYNMVTRALKLLITALTSGITPFFGDLLANEEFELLEKYFSKIEWLIHTSVIFLHGMTALLINQFVMIYTSGVKDINYYAPLFSLLLVLGSAVYAIRTPYRMLVFSAGHFKQTQTSSFIEAGLNVVLSVLLVYRLGLVGVAFGTLISMTYHIIYLVNYLSKNIVTRPIKRFMKHIVVDIITFITMGVIGNTILNLFSLNTLIDWFIVATLLGVIFLLVIIIINMFFYKDILIYYLNRVIRNKK